MGRVGVKENMNMKILLYCTKGKFNLYMPYEHDCFENDEASRFYLSDEPVLDVDFKLNGKIVGTCVCDNVEQFLMEYHNDDSVLQDIFRFIPYDDTSGIHEYDGKPFESIRICGNDDLKSIADCELLKKSCLSFDELGKYVCRDLSIDSFFALYLSNIIVFDRLKKLKDFKTEYDNVAIKRAPQNMMYAYDSIGNKYILISIRPEYLVRILNGEKTIEIRKCILKDLL